MCALSEIRSYVWDARNEDLRLAGDPSIHVYERFVNGFRDGWIAYADSCYDSENEDDDFVSLGESPDEAVSRLFRKLEGGLES